MRRVILPSVGLSVLLVLAACGQQKQQAGTPPKGDGSIVCPGAAACPKDAKYYGIAIKPTPPATPGAPASEMVCPGDPGCPAGYVGRLVHSIKAGRVTVCRAGVAPCSTTHHAIVCEDDDNNPATPAPGCPGLPESPPAK